MHKLAITSPFGRLVLGADEHVLLRIRWDETASAPAETASPILQETRRQLEAYAARRLRIFDLPMQTDGNELQEQVWAMMRTIPYGSTMTYGEMARRLGADARDVGGVCGTNRIPIVIPCHRVVGEGGRMTGFSGGRGVASKAQLLAHEGALLL